MLRFDDYLELVFESDGIAGLRDELRLRKLFCTGEAVSSTASPSTSLGASRALPSLPPASSCGLPLPSQGGAVGHNAVPTEDAQTPVYDNYLSNELDDAKDGREDDVPWREICALLIEFSTCGGCPGRIRRDTLIPYDKKPGWLATPRGAGLLRRLSRWLSKKTSACSGTSRIQESMSPRFASPLRFQAGC